MISLKLGTHLLKTAFFFSPQNYTRNGTKKTPLRKNKRTIIYKYLTFTTLTSQIIIV